MNRIVLVVPAVLAVVLLLGADVDAQMETSGRYAFKSLAQPTVGAQPGKDLSRDNADAWSEKSWIEYRNEGQRIALRLPPIGKWITHVLLDDHKGNDRRSYFNAFFEATRGQNDVTLFVKRNLNAEVTPLLPALPFCRNEQTIQLFKGSIPEEIHSTYIGQETRSTASCDLVPDAAVSDQHSVRAHFCLRRSGDAYPATLKENGERRFACNGIDEFYDFTLLCKGSEWAGKSRLEECKRLLNGIIATLRVL